MSQNVGFAVAAAINPMLLMVISLVWVQFRADILSGVTVNGLKMYESSIKRFVGGES